MQVCHETEYYCLWRNEKKTWTLSSGRQCKAHNTISDTVLTEATDLQHQLPHLPKEDCITRHTTYSSSDSQANGSQKKENIQSKVKVRGNIPSLNSWRALQILHFLCSIVCGGNWEQTLTADDAAAFPCRTQDLRKLLGHVEKKP
jgi:hypothetical protein